MGTLIWKWIAAACATVLIGLALLVGLFRVFAPQLTEYHARIEHWAGEALGAPVDIGRLDARWRLDGPELQFFDAKLLSGDGSTLAHAESGSISVRLWRLLADREISLRRITLHGPGASLERTEDGKLRLRGAAEGKIPELSLEALPRGVLELREAELGYYDSVSGLGPWRFTGIDATVEHDGRALRAAGQLELPAALGETLLFSAHVSVPEAGGSPRLALDAEAEHIELSGWDSLLPAALPAPRAGGGRVSAQAVLSGTDLEQVTVVTELAGVLPPGAESDVYERLAGRFRWAQTMDGWTASVSGLELERGRSKWPEAELDLRFVQPDRAAAPSLHAQASYLRIEDLLPLTRAFSGHALLARIDGFAPRGVLRDLTAEYAPGPAGAEFHVRAAVTDAAVQASGRLPAVSGLSGLIEATQRGGRATLDASGVSVHVAPLFKEPLHADAAAGEVVWRRDPDGWRIQSDAVVLRNADADTRTRFELALPDGDGSPALDLETEILQGRLAHFESYLPAGILPPKLLAWLERAVVDGRVASGSLSFAGMTRAFPFADGGGRLQARFRIEDATLQYAPEWPAVEGLDAELEFDNVSLRAHATAGHLAGNRVVEAQAGFDDLRTGVLELDGRTEGPLGAVQAFLMQSPLQRTLGGFAERIEVGGGEGRVDVELKLPIRRLADRQVRAGLTVQDGVIGLEGVEPRFEDVAGTMRLDGRSLSGEDIDARLFGQPVRIEVLPGADAAGATRAMAIVSGRISAQGLETDLGLPVAGRLAGEAAWLATVRFPTPDTADQAPLTLSLESDLEGLAVQLPAPFAKPAPKASPVALEFQLPEPDHLAVEGRWETGGGGQAPGDSAVVRLRLELVRSGKEWALAAGAARFGGGPPELPATGFTLAGSLPELRLEDYLALRPPGAGAGHAEAFTSARLDLGDLYALGQHVPGPVQLEVHRNPGEWLVDIESDNVAGAIFLPTDPRAGAPLLLRMDRLLLVKPDPRAQPGGAPRDPRTLPAMDIRADDFALGDRRLGALAATLVRVPAGLRLTNLASQAASFRTSGDGTWLVTAAGHQTRLALEVESEDVGATLSALGFGDPIEADTGAASFELRWPDAPTGEILDGLSGTASVRLDDGQLRDVEPGAGRVFGLLSVSALPRRMGLDFRDVFNKGLAFDKVAGDFALEDGHAYTSNLLLEGPVADIGIVGRAGLAARDYDQTAIVSANVGTSLPIAAFLAAGPQVAAAMLIFSQIFKKPLKGMTQVYYHVGGSWEDPQVERIGASQAAQDSPADGTEARGSQGEATRRPAGGNDPQDSTT